MMIIVLISLTANPSCAKS